MNHKIIPFLIFLSQITFAQSKLGETTIAIPERRMAIVIGMNAYENIKPLRNPINDAREMKVALEKLGFAVISVENKTLGQAQASINSFTNSLRSNDVVLFYFSGHGIGYVDDNFLLPTDVKVECLEQISAYSLSIKRILTDFQAKKVRNSFVILDACRSMGNLYGCSNNQKDAITSQGFIMPQNQPKGNIIVYATQAGQTADDNQKRNNGLFTQELLKYITIPNLTFGTILNKTAMAVVEESKKIGSYQEPTIYGLLGSEFVFLKTANSSSANAENQIEYEKLKAENEKLLKENSLKNKSTNTKWFLDLPFAEMVMVEGGSFLMGDAKNEGDDNEKPVHTVTLDSFFLGKYEVTQQQWIEIMGDNPSQFNDCLECPVEKVNFTEIQEFIAKLNTKTGQNFRLPTEAEWEYAAGGGNKGRTRFGNGNAIADPDQINLNGSKNFKKDYSIEGVYRKRTLKVGSFQANGLGLFDMAGNVSEWCSDWYEPFNSKSVSNPTGPTEGTIKVLKGGNWYNYPEYCRITYRQNIFPNSRFNTFGFRLAASL